MSEDATTSIEVETVKNQRKVEFFWNATVNVGFEVDKHREPDQGNVEPTVSARHVARVSEVVVKRKRHGRDDECEQNDNRVVFVRDDDQQHGDDVRQPRHDV